MDFSQLEDIQFCLFDAISLFGIIQGIVISITLIVNKRYNIPTRGYYVLLLLVCLSINVFEMFSRTHIIDSALNFWILPVSFFPLIIPAVYFIFKYYLTLDSKVVRWEYSLYIPFAIGILYEFYMTTNYISGNLNLFTIDILFGHTNYFILGIELISAIMCLIMFSYFILEVKRNKQKMYANFSGLTFRGLAWLTVSLLGGIGLSIISISKAFLEFKGENLVNQHDRTALEFGITIFIYGFSYGVIMHPELFKNASKNLNQTNNETENDSIRIANDQLSDKTEEYHEKLLMLMSEKALYKDPDFNLARLAEEMNLSKSYVSKIINNKEGKSFFDFVNYYRVEEVKRKLKDESFDHFSIITIALEAGFKSKSTFNTVFKKMTNLTPSKYKKKIRTL